MGLVENHDTVFAHLLRHLIRNLRVEQVVEGINDNITMRQLQCDKGFSLAPLQALCERLPFV